MNEFLCSVKSSGGEQQKLSSLVINAFVFNLEVGLKAHQEEQKLERKIEKKIHFKLGMDL